MIKNWQRRLSAAAAVAVVVVAAGFAAGCEPAVAHPGAFQGVIELDERQLGFETGGRLVSVDAQRGAVVHAGDVLAALDDTLARTARDSREAEAQAAEARLALLRAGSRGEDVRAMAAELAAARATEDLLATNAARQRALVQSGALAQASLDEAEASLASQKARRQAIEQRLHALRSGARKQEVEGAEAQAKAAEKAVALESERLARHVLRAPAEGTVLDVHVDPGEIVGAGTPVLTIADTGHPYIDVFVPQGDLEGVRAGAAASVHVDATPDAFSGRVEDVGRRTEFTPRYLFSDRERPALVVRVRVRVDDPQQRLHAGVPAFVSIDRSGATSPLPAPPPVSSVAPAPSGSASAASAAPPASTAAPSAAPAAPSSASPSSAVAASPSSAGARR